MTDVAFQRKANPEFPSVRVGHWTYWLPIVLAIGVLVTALTLVFAYQNAALDAPALVDSTPGQLALWMVEQSKLDAPVSLLGGYAKSWAQSLGRESLDEEIVLNTARVFLVLLGSASVALTLAGTAGLALKAAWSRAVLLLALVGFDVLVFNVPVLDGDNTAGLVLLCIFLMLGVLLFSPGRVTKVLGFMVVLSALLMTWEVFKAFSQSIDYKVRLPLPSWTYTSYPTTEETLAALQNGEVVAVIADRRELEPLMALSEEQSGKAPVDPAATDYPDLRLLSVINTDMSFSFFPVNPLFPGRLGVAVREQDTARWSSVTELVGQPLGTPAEQFAEQRFLGQPRALIPLDLTIGNDLNMPHLQSIAKALLQPARRNGPVLLARILGDAALFTWTEALIGFTAGALLGFGLGTLFAHSALMQRGLLPYVVASQTVPILAIAPMVVIWLGPTWAAVAVISAYLTFFPVTINTLRGLLSPHPNALELMHSYAASRWTIMWKLRFPAALPYIFTALKVSATASVVGAIIGELPSGISSGLGRAILDFNQYYTSDPAKLWGAIFIAALVGMVFFVLVVILERLLLPRTAQEV